MAATSRTSDFRDAVHQAETRVPDAKRRRISRPSRRSADDKQDALNKEYMAEAYVVLNHISTLTRMLASVRKAYLNHDTRSGPLLRPAARTIDLSGADSAWADIRHLTNEERDQIDLQARVILTRCKDRVAQLEELEKRRSAHAAAQQSPLARLLPARLRQDASAAASDFVAAHHAGVTWYLSRRLAEASEALKGMQEERVRRQLERTRTLGSGAAREAAYMSAAPAPPSPTDSSASGSWLGVASSFAASMSGQAPSVPAQTQARAEWLDDTEDEDDMELSASQIQQFEEENAHILRHVQDNLASVQQAESRLLEISALQMELVAHLTKQTEQTEQLYEDAIATAATVEKGNEQLKEARRRARDGRKWILMFLVGASLSLLFLHYY